MLQRILFTLILTTLVTGCSTRQLQGSLQGSTAQRLVTHSIDDMIGAIDGEKLEALTGQKVFLRSYFLKDAPLKAYADERLSLELSKRFGADMVETQGEADAVMTVFYTSLATDLDNFGITIPVGSVPGLESYSDLNVFSLEKFHGVSEMYYFVGPTGTEHRSKVIHAKVKTDALGLPFITIPLSNIDRH